MITCFFVFLDIPPSDLPLLSYSFSTFPTSFSLASLLFLKEKKADSLVQNKSIKFVLCACAVCALVYARNTCQKLAPTINQSTARAVGAGVLGRPWRF